MKSVTPLMCRNQSQCFVTFWSVWQSQRWTSTAVNPSDAVSVIQVGHCGAWHFRVREFKITTISALAKQGCSLVDWQIMSRTKIGSS